MGVPFYILSWLQDLECSEPPYLSTFGCCPVPPRLIEGRDFEMQKWKRLKLSHPTKWTTGPPLSKRGGPNISIAIHHSKPFWCIQQPPGSAKTPPSVAKASSRATNKFSTASSSSLVQDPSQTQSYLATTQTLLRIPKAMRQHKVLRDNVVT